MDNIKTIRGFTRPFGINFDEKGNIFVADFGDHSIRYFTPEGDYVDTITCTRFATPHSISFDASGNLFVCEYGIGRIQKISSDLQKAEPFLENLSGPATAYLNHDKTELLVTSFNSSSVDFYDLSGKLLRSINKDLNRPHQTLQTPDGSYFVADTHNHSVKKYDAELNVILVIPAFNQVTAIALEGDYLYTGEYGANRIHKYRTDGTWVDTWHGDFNHVYDVKVRDGKVYVADADNREIKIRSGF